MSEITSVKIPGLGPEKVIFSYNLTEALELSAALQWRKTLLTI